MQVAKLFSSGQSSNEIATPRPVRARNDKKGPVIASAAKQSRRGMRLPRPFSGARNDQREPSVIATMNIHGAELAARNDRSAWWWTEEATIKICRGDLQEPVSSLFLGLMNSTDYPCPRSILHREVAGRSWAMNNTSNIPGVD
jgi:hypothetical protein